MNMILASVTTPSVIQHHKCTARESENFCWTCKAMLVPWKSVKELMEKAVSLLFAGRNKTRLHHFALLIWAWPNIEQFSHRRHSVLLKSTCVSAQGIWQQGTSKSESLHWLHTEELFWPVNLSLFSRRICTGTTQNGVVQSSEKGFCPRSCYSCHRHPKPGVREEQLSSLGENRTPWQMEKWVKLIR